MAVTFKNWGSWVLLDFWISGHKDGHFYKTTND